MGTSTIILLVVLGLVVIGVLWAVTTYNKLIRLRNEKDQSFSGIDVQLTRRAELIPNLVNTVKGYAAHESSVFEAVTEARAKTLGASTVQEKANADAVMGAALTGLFGVAEAYPDLKANQNFLDLQAQLTDTEDKIAAARRYYNSVVQRYNTAIQVMPASIIAGLGKFQAAEFFEASDTSIRTAGAPPVTF